MSDSLVVELADLPDEHEAGRFLLPSVRVVNDGQTAEEVSRRLNLLEGDLALSVRSPDGDRTRHHAATVIDSLPRQTTVDPGETLGAGVFASHTNHGVPFTTPGRYELVAEYAPDRTTSLTSDPVAFTVVDADPSTAELTALTGREDVCRAVARYSFDEPTASVREAFETLSTRFSGTPEGVVAALFLLGRRDDVSADDPAFGLADPVTTARYVSALAAPNPERHQLCQAFLASLSADTRAEEVAAAVAACEPYPTHP